MIYRFDVAAWIKAHIIDSEKAKEATQGGLRIAGTSGLTKQEDAIGIVLSVDKDDATQRAERDREAAAKRQQNLLPAWHLKSTISGDLTALGVKESAARKEDDLHLHHRDGAGVVEANRLPSLVDGGAKSGVVVVQGGTDGEKDKDQDRKPTVAQTDEADCKWTSTHRSFIPLTPSLSFLSFLSFFGESPSIDYDQYYASLAASSAPSAQVTPILPDVASDFGEEEEDVKPSLEYLTSLNEYRKRSRSREDVDGGSATPKMQKLNGHADVNGIASSGFGSANASVESVLVSTSVEVVMTNGVGYEESAAMDAVPAADDPIVYGKPLYYYFDHTFHCIHCGNLVSLLHTHILSLSLKQ